MPAASVNTRARGLDLRRVDYAAPWSPRPRARECQSLQVLLGNQSLLQAWWSVQQAQAHGCLGQLLRTQNIDPDYSDRPV